MLVHFLLGKKVTHDSSCSIVTIIFHFRFRTPGSAQRLAFRRQPSRFTLSRQRRCAMLRIIQPTLIDNSSFACLACKCNSCFTSAACWSMRAFSLMRQNEVSIISCSASRNRFHYAGIFEPRTGRLSAAKTTRLKCMHISLLPP